VYSVKRLQLKMASKTAQMESISESYIYGLRSFQKLNAVLFDDFQVMANRIQKWSKSRGSEEIELNNGGTLLATAFELQKSHQLLKDLKITFTRMYNKLMIEYGQPGALHGLNCGEYPVDETFTFPILEEGECLSDVMTELMFEEKSLLHSEEEFSGKVYSEKLKKLEELRQEICDPPPKYDDEYCDCTGYHPTDSLVEVLVKVVRLNRDKVYRIFLDSVAKICHEYGEIFKDFGLCQYKTVAAAFFEDGIYNHSRMQVLWYVTKLKGSRQMKGTQRIWERAEIWEYFNELINKFITYSMSHAGTKREQEMEEEEARPDPTKEVATCTRRGTRGVWLGRFTLPIRKHKSISKQQDFVELPVKDGGPGKNCGEIQFRGQRGEYVTVKNEDRKQMDIEH